RRLRHRPPGPAVGRPRPRNPRLSRRRAGAPREPGRVRGRRGAVAPLRGGGVGAATGAHGERGRLLQRAGPRRRVAAGPPRGRRPVRSTTLSPGVAGGGDMQVAPALDQLPRSALLAAAFEHMLGGMIVTRAMLPQVILRGGDLALMNQIAIDEWMGA